ncbi:MAG TPA: hypothetical protein VEA41_02160 [Salinarimonas sp.]|nr:hypothetical protein [Salinarimonas sp.]
MQIYCWLHRKGVPPEMPPFFFQGCRTCEDKKARGLVTGNEGPPDTRKKKLQARIAAKRLMAGDAP